MSSSSRKIALTFFVFVVLATSVRVAAQTPTPSAVLPPGLVVFEAQRDDDAGQTTTSHPYRAFVYDTTSNNVYRMTDAVLRQAAWAPDRPALAGQTMSGGNGEIAIVSLRLVAGSGLVQDQLQIIAPNPSYDGEPSWSADGKSIAFHSDRSGGADIYAVPAAGGAPTNISNDNSSSDFNPWFASRRDALVWTAGKAGREDLWIQETDGSRHCVTCQLGPINRSANAVWSPDDQLIAFAGSRSNSKGDIYTIRPDGTNLKLVSPNTVQSDETEPTFSPDGRWIAYTTNRLGTWDVWVTDISGTQHMPLTSGPSNDENPQWTGVQWLTPTATTTPSTMPPAVPTATLAATPTELPTALPSATPTPTPSQTPLPPQPIYLPLALSEQNQGCPPLHIFTDTVMVIDSSTSMLEPVGAGKTKFAAATDAALAFVESMRVGEQQDHVAVVLFNRGSQRLVGLTGDARRVHEALRADESVIVSGSRIDLGIEAAIDELESPRRVQANTPAILLLSDGKYVAPAGAVGDEDVMNQAARAHQLRVALYAVGLGRTANADLLRRIVGSESRYLEAPDPTQLSAVYRRLAFIIPCDPIIYWGGR